MPLAIAITPMRRIGPANRKDFGHIWQRLFEYCPKSRFRFGRLVEAQTGVGKFETKRSKSTNGNRTDETETTCRRLGETGPTTNPHRLTSKSNPGDTCGSRRRYALLYLRQTRWPYSSTARRNECDGYFGNRQKNQRTARLGVYR